MLTTELVRYSISGEKIAPKTISERYYYKCQELINLYKANIGQRKSKIYAELSTLEEKRTDYRVIRGLAKILEDAAATFEPKSILPSETLRDEIFTRAQKEYPIVYSPDLLDRKTADHILQELAIKYGTTRQEIKDSIYADREENFYLTKFDMAVTPEWLIERYNLALHQAMLYHATLVTIHIFGQYKHIFRYIKLCQLMYDIKPKDNGYEILLNGPVSLLRNTQRYGIKMATFLPALVQLPKFTLWAKVNYYNQNKIYYLTEKAQLRSCYPLSSEFDSSVEEKFYNSFVNKNTSWKIYREDTIINLSGSVFIPDFTFVHTSGRKIYLEVVGFWTPNYLHNKIVKLKKVNCKDIIFAVAEQLNCSRENFAGEVLFYKTSIKIDSILATLEKALQV